MKTITKADVLEYIAQQDLDGLEGVIEIIQVRKKHLAQRAKNSFRVGDTVKVSGLRKTGAWAGTFEGTIVKKNPKRCKVQIVHPVVHRGNVRRSTTWNLPYNMIERVDG